MITRISGAIVLCHSLCLLALLLPALAQEAEVPKPPYVIVPKRAAWTIVVDGKDNAKSTATPAALPAASVRVESEKFDDLKKDVISVPGQPSREVWYRGGLLLLPNEASDYVVVTTPTGDGEATTPGLLYSADFPAVSWIDQDSFKDVIDWHQEKCLYFEKNDKVKMKAWIAASTRRPLAIEIGDFSYVFTFRDSPTQALALPAIYAEAWSRYERLAARRKAFQISN